MKRQLHVTESIENVGRREFIRRASGLVTLAGTSLITHHGWIKSAHARVKPAGNAALIHTHEWYGDIEERLDFPATWDVTTYHMAGHERPVLAPNQIRKNIQSPIGTQPLRDIAAGKERVVITFDDLTRPTPTNEVIGLIIDEILAAGVKEEAILLLTSMGNHRAMTHVEVGKKVGPDIAGRYPWQNHNIWENLVDLGVTSRNNRIKINHHFARADLKITISGVKPHGAAGYGGGAKAVLPGVAWINTSDYMHRTVIGAPGNRDKRVGVGKVMINPARQDMIEAARLANVDFSVQIVYNGRRRPIGVFAGDIVDAHEEACRFANRQLRTAVAHNADIVIANAYPQNRQAMNSLSWARKCVRPDGSAVLIVQNPMGMSEIHYLAERWNYKGVPFWSQYPAKSAPVPQAAQTIVFSQYLGRKDRHRIGYKNVVYEQTWEGVLNRLKQRHRSEATVAVYPYAPLQHEDIELT